MEKLKLAARTAMLQAAPPFVPAISHTATAFHGGLPVSSDSISLASHTLQLSPFTAAALSSPHHHQSYLSQLPPYHALPGLQPPSDLLTVFPY